MKKFFSLLIVLIALLTIGCNGQPKSTYEASWQPLQGVQTINLYFWTGTDSTHCPFVQNQNYKDSLNNIEEFQIATLPGTARLYDMDLDNSPAGQNKFIVIGGVTFASDGTWSGLSKSYAFKLSNIPPGLGFIIIRKK